MRRNVITTRRFARPPGCAAVQRARWTSVPRSARHGEPGRGLGALAPVRVDASRAKAVVIAVADEIIDDDAVRVDRQYLPGLLVDDVLHPTEDSHASVAATDHLAIEPEPMCPVSLVEGFVVPRLDLDEISDLQVEVLDHAINERT